MTTIARQSRGVKLGEYFCTQGLCFFALLVVMLGLGFASFFWWAEIYWPIPLYLGAIFMGLLSFFHLRRKLRSMKEVMKRKMRLWRGS